MSFISLNWLIHSSSLTNIRCVSCAEKLENPVFSVTVLDDPDVIKWIKPDELVLTTGYIFRDDTKMQERLLRELRDADCAALGIKVKQYFNTIPPNMIRLAEEIGLVLIELPFYYPFSEICRLIYQEMFSQEQSEDVLRQQQLEALIDLSFSGAGLNRIVRVLSDSLARSVLILDSGHNCVSAGLMPEDAYLLSDGDTLQIRFDLSSASRRYLRGDSHSLYRQLALVNGVERHCLARELPGETGLACLLLDPSDREEVLADLFDRAAVVAAWELRDVQRSTPSARPYYDYFFHFLQLEQLEEKKPAEEIIRICNSYGFDFESKRVCVSFMPDRKADDRTRTRTLQYMRSESRRVLKEACPSFCCYNDEMISFFFFFPPDKNPADCLATVEEMVRQHMEQLATSVTCPVWAGISRCHDKIETIQTAYRDSVGSIRMGWRLGMAGRVFSYNRMITYFLLANLARDSLEKLYEDSVQQLVEYDAKNGTDLLETLTVYYENKFNAVATSRQLYLHRNTLLNRLERIRHLLGVDIDDHRESNRLHLGLCAYGLLTGEVEDGRE